jgi:hypothetical protein
LKSIMKYEHLGSKHECEKWSTNIVYNPTPPP